MGGYSKKGSGFDDFLCKMGVHSDKSLFKVIAQGITVCPSSKANEP